jgi:hypothetical protein
MHLLPVSASICLFATGATLARAEDEPPSTTTATTTATTTTTVAPDGAYGWELARPEPRRQSQSPAAPPPAVRTTTPPPAPTTVSQPHEARHAKPRHVRATRTVHIVQPQRTGAVLAASTTAAPSLYASTLILGALGLAIACFSVGATPARRVRWRTGSTFVAYHSTQATVAGGIALLLAVALLVLTGGR